MRQSPPSESYTKFSQSRNSPPFMKPESSLQYSREWTTGPRPKPNKLNSQSSTIFPYNAYQDVLPPGTPNIPMRATCPIHLFSLDFIILITFSEPCSLQKSNAYLFSWRSHEILGKRTHTWLPFQAFTIHGDRNFHDRSRKQRIIWRKQEAIGEYIIRHYT